MVRALLEGRKSQTRRLLTPRYVRVCAASPEQPGYRPDAELLAAALIDARDFRLIEGQIMTWQAKAFDYQVGDWTTWLMRVAPAVGDRLWVKESYLPDPSADDDAWDDWTETYFTWSGCGSKLAGIPPALRTPANVLFAADPKWSGDRGWRWRPSIHMPRWASRLTLVVEGVRFQRLQEISEADAIAEGLLPANEGYALTSAGECWGPTAAKAYRVLWNSLHGEDSWHANPWVIALTFRVERGNIDQVPA